MTFCHFNLFPLLAIEKILVLDSSLRVVYIRPNSDEQTQNQA